MLVGKRKAFCFKFQAEENGDEGGSGAGGSATIDMNNPVIKAAMQAAIDAEVAGLKAKNQELIGKLQKAPKLEQAEYEKLLEMKKNIEANEEMKLLAEGKLEEVMKKRTEARDRDVAAQLQARDTKLNEYESVIKAKDERLKSLAIDGNIRSAYAELDFEPAALDDILLQARTMFHMDDEGNVAPRDSDGVLRMGKDGRTPLSAKEWLEGLAEKKTYLRRASKGSGAAPAKGGTRGFDASKASSTQLIAEGLRQRGRV
jgi:hypothetical protein